MTEVGGLQNQGPLSGAHHTDLIACWGSSLGPIKGTKEYLWQRPKIQMLLMLMETGRWLHGLPQTATDFKWSVAITKARMPNFVLPNIVHALNHPFLAITIMILLTALTVIASNIPVGPKPLAH